MREILFRGKRFDNGEWVYGSFVKAYDGEACFIMSEKSRLGDNTELEYWRVDPETVGQYIGVEDMNGKKIFEGDIIEFYFCGKRHTDKIVFEPPMFTRGDWMGWSFGNEVVIGDVYDNPELLEAQQ